MQAELRQVGLQSSSTTARIQQLDNMLRGSTADLQGQLEELLAAFRAAQDEITEKRILNSLAFADMDARFISVHDAERDTFDWIFNDPDSLLAKEPGLAMSFTDWLKSGSGIFHIVGKPGSGKSTLMKHLCGHPETMESLEEWASVRGTELIFCKFFFWRVTPIAEQKTLKGLIRGLLHSVLSQVPSLSKQLFPRQWPLPGKTKRVPELGDRQFSEAFEILVRDDAILDEFCFCFFIDGLDEFEASIHLQSETHYALANKLLKWAIDSKGRVKMCVSSRHFPEFTRKFPSSQQLTLQKLTEADIRALLVNRLESNERFVELGEKSEDQRARCEELVRVILESAEGVFLWVVLVLNELERALVTSDSLELLERIVSTAPKEIKGFVQSVLLSIPEIHRQGAHYLLAVVMRMQGIVTSRAKAAKVVKAVVDAAIEAYSEQLFHIHLRECAMLFDAADGGRLLDCPQDMAVVTCDLTNDLAVEKERERLAERCRGLVEPDPKLNVRFTHRAIPEALQDFFFRDKSEVYVEDGRVAEVLTWILLGDIRLRGREELSPHAAEKDRWLNGESSIRRLRYVALLRLRLYPGPLDDSERMMRLLHHITEAILSAHYDTPTPDDDQTWGSWRWERRHLKGDGTPPISMRRQLPLGVFDNFQLHEFAVWLISNKLSWENDRSRLLAYLREVIMSAGRVAAHHSSAAFEPVLDALQQCGVTLADNQHDTRQVWHEFVCRELHYAMTHNSHLQTYDDDPGLLRMQIHWKGFERLLRLGADPALSLSWDGTQRLLLGPAEERLFTVDESEGGDFNSEARKSIPEWPAAISLEALIKFYKPSNMARLLELIRENAMEKPGRSDTDASKRDHGVSSEPEMASLGSIDEATSQQARLGLAHRTTW